MTFVRACLTALLLAACALPAALPAQAQTQSYPNRPIRMIASQLALWNGVVAAAGIKGE